MSEPAGWRIIRITWSDQVWWTTYGYNVLDSSGPQFSSRFLIVARLWGLLHGHGWLPVTAE